MKIPGLITTLALIILAVAGNATLSSAEKSAKGRASTMAVTSTSSTAATDPRFSSRYTPLAKCGSGMTKKEEREAEKQGSDIPTLCKGFGGYDIYISYSACTSEILAQKGAESIRLASQAVNWKQKTVEWRVAQVGSNRKPFAVIMRVYEYGGDEYCATGGKITGEFLVVKGLKGYEHIDVRVDVKATANPNVKARQLADKGYALPPT